MRVKADERAGRVSDVVVDGFVFSVIVCYMCVRVLFNSMCIVMILRASEGVISVDVLNLWDYTTDQVKYTAEQIKTGVFTSEVDTRGNDRDLHNLLQNSCFHLPSYSSTLFE